MSRIAREEAKDSEKASIERASKRQKANAIDFAQEDEDEDMQLEEEQDAAEVERHMSGRQKGKRPSRIVEEEEPEEPEPEPEPGLLDGVLGGGRRG